MNANKEKFLLFRVRKFRDQESFKELMKIHGTKLQRFLILKLPRKQDAEDAFSDTSLRIWNYTTSSVVESFSGLIFTIARGVVADFYRKRSPEVVSIDVSQEIASKLTSKQGAFQIMAETDTALLKRALDELTDEQKQVIIMRHFEGHSIRKISKVLGKSEGATSVFLHRTIKVLRENIES